MEAEVCLSRTDRERLEELRQSDRVEIGGIPDPGTGENAGATFYETEVRDERNDETVVNENEKEIAQSLVNDWMVSPAHRENILDERWNSISVGVYVSEGKTVFATQVFCGLNPEFPDVNIE